MSTKGTSWVNNSRLEKRPYVGSWKPNFRKVHTWSPDALVYFNGQTALYGCQECNNKIDFQPFITSANVESGVQSSSASASINFSMPKHLGDSIFKDGTFILTVGIEVHIYYRGYFNANNLLSSELIDYGDEVYDLKDLKMKPYYPVFHGVITNVSYTYSGGFYSGSLSCNSILHFWQYQVINVNSAGVGAPVGNSSNNLMGHKFQGWSPHQIILYLANNDIGGEQKADLPFGVGSTDNVRNDGGTWQAIQEYWRTRFSQGLYNLKLYGASGKPLSNEALQYLSSAPPTVFNVSTNQQNTPTPTTASPSNGLYNPVDNRLRTLDLAESPVSGINIGAILPFTPDASQVGQFEAFQSTYETKLSIADTVAEKTSWEFYQDLNGDLTFKPPMYNLNVKSSRIYTIKPEDILDIGFSQKEPTATYMVCKGNLFGAGGLGGDNEMIAPNAQYVDYKLVAKFGWRESSFDASHINDPKSAYYMAARKLDLINKDVEGCTLSIPLRPELKPGYPIYIEHIDCFYYVEGISHSFSFGGECTTSLTLVCRRRKFILPGNPTNNYAINPGSAIDCINISQPNKYLTVKDTDGNIRIKGFPNVVMGIDQTKINPATLPAGADNIEISTPEHLKMLIVEATSFNILQLSPNVSMSGSVDPMTTGPFIVRSSSTDGDEGQYIGEVTYEDLLSEIGQSSTTLNLNQNKQEQYISDATNTLGEQQSPQTKRATLSDLIELVKSKRSEFKAGSKTNVLASLSNRKSSFNQTVGGEFRYFTSSHLDKNMQGSTEIVVKDNKIDFKAPPPIEINPNIKNTNIVKPDPSSIDGNTVEIVNDPNAIQSGLRIIDTEGDKIKATCEINSLCFQRLDIAIPTTVLSSQTPGTPTAKLTSLTYLEYARIMRDQFFSKGRPIIKQARINTANPNINKDICFSILNADTIDETSEDILKAFGDGSLCDGNGSSLVGEYAEINGVGLQRIIQTALIEWNKKIFDAPVAGGPSERLSGAQAAIDPRNIAWQQTPSKPILDIYTDANYKYDCQIPWCGAFVLYVLKNSGALKPKGADGKSLYGDFLRGCTGIFNNWGSTARFIPFYLNRQQEIRPGDIVVFNKIDSNTGAPIDRDKPHGTHVSICYQVNTENIICIDGNSTGEFPDGSKGSGVVKTRRTRDKIWYLYRLLPDDFDTNTVISDQPNETDSAIKAKLNNMVTNLMKLLKKKHSVLTELEKAGSNSTSVDLLYSTQPDNLIALQNDLKLILDKVGGLNLNSSYTYNSTASQYQDDPTVSPVFPVSDDEGYEVFGAFPYGRGISISPSGGFASLLRSDEKLKLDEINTFLTNVNDSSNKTNETVQQLGDITLDNTPKIFVNQDAKLNKESADMITDSGLANTAISQSNTSENLVIESVPLKLQDIIPSNYVSGADAVCDCRSYDSEINLLGASLEDFKFVEVGSDSLTKKMANDYYSKAEEWKSNQNKLIGGQG